MKKFMWIFLASIFCVAFAFAVPQVTINSPLATDYSSSSILFNLTLNETGQAWFNLNNGSNISLNSTDNLTFIYFNASVPDGSYTAYFFANNSNNSINDSEYVSFSVDTTSPLITIVSPTPGQTFTSSTVLFNITSNEVLDSPLVEVFNGSMYFNLSLSSEDNSSWNASGNLPNGDFVATFYTADTLGNQNNSELVNFSVNYTEPDMIPPTITINNPTNGTTYYDGLFNFSVTLNEEGSVWFNVNNGVNVSMNSADNLTFNFSNSSNTDGHYVITFFASDTLNNTNTSTVEFDLSTLDVVAPQLTIILPTPNQNITESLEVVFNVSSDETLSFAWFNLNNGTNQTLFQENSTVFSFTNSSVPNGVYTAYFFANDTSGNVNNSEFVTFVVNYTAPDITPPNITINSPANATTYYDGVFNFNITLDEEGSAWFSVNGDVNTSMSSSDNLTFTFSNASNVDGTYQVDFFVNDTSGNEANLSVEFTLDTLDTTNPQLTIVSPTPSQNITSSSQVIFNISSDENLSAAWFNLNNGINYSLSSENATQWSYVNASVPNGAYVAQFFANDSSGNINGSESVSFNVNYVAPDTTAPNISVSSPSNNSAYNSSSLTFLVNLDEQGTVWFNFSSAPGVFYFMNTSDNQSFNYTNASIADGTYSVQFFANDSSNNIANKTYVFVMDTVGPSYTIITPTPNQSYTASPEVIFNITSNEILNTAWIIVYYGGLNYTYILSTTDNASWTYTNSSVSNWNYAVWFFANDSVGNVNGSSPIYYSVNYTAPDTTAPSFTITTPTDAATYNQSAITLNITITEQGSAWFNLSTNASQNITMNTTDNLTFTFSYANLSDATYGVTFFANDSSGNENQTSVSFTIDTSIPDTTKPQITIITPTQTIYNTSSLVFNISTNENLSAAWFNLNNGTNYSLSSENETQWSYTNNSVSDGNYTAYFFANDTSNNVNDSQSVSFTVDTTAPLIGLTVPANNSVISPFQELTYTITDTTTVSVNYTVNGDTYATTNTTLTPFENLTSGTYNFSITAVDQVSLSTTSTQYTFLIDTTSPSLTITVVKSTTPSNISVFVNDSFGNVSSVWYDFNGAETRTVNASVNQSIYTTNLVGQLYPGAHTLIFFANDSVGNQVNQTVYMNVTGVVNLTQQQNQIVSSANSASGQFILANGTVINGSSQDSFNNTALQNLTLIISLNQTTPITINFSGIDGSRALWNMTFTNLSDSNTNFSGSVDSNFSTQTVLFLQVIGQNKVFPSGSYGVINVLFNISPTDITDVYYFAGNTISYAQRVEANMCEGGSYSSNDTIPCWVNQSNKVKLFLSSFSTVLLTNDTVAPNITVDTPNSTHLQSEFTPTINVSLDTTSCTLYYNNTNQTYTGTFNNATGQCTFATLDATDGFNGTLNFTASDEQNNTASLIFPFVFADTTDPIVNITAPINGSTKTSSPITISVTVNEKSTVIKSNNGGSYTSCFSEATSGSCSVSVNSDGSRYVRVNVTDLSGNSVLETVYFTVNLPDEEEDDDSGGSGGSGGGSGGSSGASLDDFREYFNELEDEDVQEELEINLTPKTYETTLVEETDLLLRVNDSAKVSINNKEVLFSVSSYDDVQKVVTLTYGGKEVTVSMTSSSLLDIDDDGVYDVEITVKNIAAGRAQIVFSKPEEITPLIEPSLVNETNQSTQELDTKTPLYPFIISGVLLVLLVVLIFLKYHHDLKGRPPKKYHHNDTTEFSANDYLNREK